jgi:uncharacterized protein (TIGR03437 family)
MKNMVFVLAMVLTATISALAQANQSRIVDLNGVGVPDVTINETAMCVGVSHSKTYVTDANGNFMWPQLGPPPNSGSGSNCAASLVKVFTLKKDGYVFTRDFFISSPTSLSPYDDRIPLIQATTLPTWKIVSAASYRPPTPPLSGNAFFPGPSPAPAGIASEMIVAGFGSELATNTESAQEPVTTLAGRKILVKDSAGIEKSASLFYVSPTQINFLTPEGLADGPAVFRVIDESDNLIKVGLVEIKKVSHGIFTANFDGAGPPSAYIVRVKPPNVQVFEPVAEFDEAAQKYVPTLIDHGPEEDILILVLFGTGWRNASLESSQFWVAEGFGQATMCPINYLGKQPTFLGLDQANVVLPRSLIGKREVDLVFNVGAFTARRVRLKFK